MMREADGGSREQPNDASALQKIMMMPQRLRREVHSIVSSTSQLFTNLSLPMPAAIHAARHSCTRPPLPLSGETDGSTYRSPSARKQSRCRKDEFPRETLETPFAARLPEPASRSGY